MRCCKLRTAVALIYTSGHFCCSVSVEMEWALGECKFILFLPSLYLFSCTVAWYTLYFPINFFLMISSKYIFYYCFILWSIVDSYFPVCENAMKLLWPPNAYVEVGIFQEKNGLRFPWNEMLVFSESYWNEREPICFIKLSLVLVRASDRDLSWAWRIARDMLKGLKSSHYELVTLSMNVFSTQMHLPLTKLDHATELQTLWGR